MSDVGSYPFIQAAHCYAGRQRQPRLIVLHDMEAPENATTAETVARYFARKDSRDASAHFCVDSDSAIRCVHDSDTAWAAKNANADGLHIEHAGYARQTQQEWVDSFGRAMLARSAQVAALWCRRYNIPARRLSVKELKAGLPGIVGHADVSAAWPSTGHTDPGAGFPWAFYLDLVNSYLTPSPPKDDDMAITPEGLKQIDALIQKRVDDAVAKLHAEHVLILHGDEYHPISLDSIAAKLGMTPR